MKATIHIYYKDSRPVALFIDVHQILMTGEHSLSLSFGTQVATIPYEEVREIRVRFSE